MVLTVVGQQACIVDQLQAKGQGVQKPQRAGQSSCCGPLDAQAAINKTPTTAKEQPQPYVNPGWGAF